MKRIWIGIGLLMGLLVLGFVASNQMVRVHLGIAKQLEQAAQEPQWEQAVSLSREAKEAWHRHRSFTASLSEHDNIDQIDSLFAQLEVYQTQADPLSHASACAYLSEAISALLDAHRLTWWNLL